MAYNKRIKTPEEVTEKLKRFRQIGSFKAPEIYGKFVELKKDSWRGKPPIKGRLVRKNDLAWTAPTLYFESVENLVLIYYESENPGTQFRYNICIRDKIRLLPEEDIIILKLENDCNYEI
jgi:hypothetical protein